MNQGEEDDGESDDGGDATEDEEDCNPVDSPLPAVFVRHLEPSRAMISVRGSLASATSAVDAQVGPGETGYRRVASLLG